VLGPALDAALGGGASILLVAILLAAGPISSSPQVIARFAILSILVNWPHFMGSYKVLYGTPGALKRHPFATLWVPIGLALYAICAAALYGREPLLFHAFHAAAAVYLAWHYTGQAWGTIAAFAYAEGVKVGADARWPIRANLRVLLAFHAVWAVHTFAARIGFAPIAILYEALGAAAAGSALLGALGFWRLGRIPARVILPWLAIHAWYLLIWRQPGALFWVQCAHAAQYLPFPLRIEANRAAEAPRDHGWRLYLSLVVCGSAAFWAAPWAANKAAFLTASALPAGILVADLLNIHHYFVDGCIWKLSNPEVRRDLFRHLEPAASAS
jgi:hypothetical protein